MSERFTGEEVGKLGFGFMRMPMAEGLGIDHRLLRKMVDKYLEEGFSYFDTSYVYMGSEEALCEALVKRHPRDSFRIATKMPLFVVKSPDDMKSTFRTSMERLGIDYLDFYLFHGVTRDNIELLESIGAWEYVRELKDSGQIKHYGFSYHDTPELLDQLLTSHPDTEFVQLQINYLDWDNPKVQSRRLFETVRRHNKPFTIMGPVKGGLLAGVGSNVEKALREVNSEVSAASWAVRFAASLEGLITMLSGMGSMEQLEDNIHTIKNLKPLSDDEHAALRKVVDMINSVPCVQCTGCKYCVDPCPQKLNIPKLINLYNEHITYHQKSSIGYPYEEATVGGRFPRLCTACRTCEAHCPQHIGIADIMKEMASIY